MDGESSLKDSIFVIPEALDGETCRKIVEFYDSAGRYRPSTYSDYDGEIADSSARVAMEDCWMKTDEPYFQTVFDATIEGAWKYNAIYADLNLSKSGGLRMNRYFETGFMSRHVDNIHGSHGQKEGYPSVSCIFILNAEFEGGDLTFFGNHVVPNRTGQVLYFPSSFLFPHEVTPVTKGMRYSIVTWLM